MTIKLTATEVDELVDALAALLGHGDFDIYPDYSGRGMYGATCLGITHDAPIAVAVGVAAAEVFGDDGEMSNSEVLYELATGMRTDSMGLGGIIYWPDIELESDDEEAS